MIHFSKIITFAVLFFHLGILGVSAQEDASISVKAGLDKASITIGDPVVYEVTIHRKPSVQILSSIPAPASDIFRVKKIEDVNRQSDGHQIEGKRFTLTAFRLGNFVIDPVEIQYREGSGDIQTLSTQKIYLKVKSVAEGEEKEDIRGIKSVLAFASKILLWMIILLLIAGAIAGFLFYRNLRNRDDADKEPETKLTAEQEAMLHLNQLFDSDLLRKDQYKQYYLLLSEILRTYLEKRYKILAIEATTFEIEQTLRKDTTMDSKLRDKVIEVLESADLAKFAKWKPAPTETLSLNKRSKEIVEESKPAPALKEEEEEEQSHAV